MDMSKLRRRRPDKKRPGAPKILIVGAGYAGCALAHLLSRDLNEFQVHVLERSSKRWHRPGHIKVTRGPELLRCLGLDEHVGAFDHGGKACDIGRAELLRILQTSLLATDTIWFDTELKELEASSGGIGGMLRAQVAKSTPSGTRREWITDVALVVGADGLVSTTRRLSGDLLRVALMGDARRPFGCELDFGCRRISYGSTAALEDAIALAAMVGAAEPWLLTAGGHEREHEFQWASRARAAFGRFSSVDVWRPTSLMRSVGFYVPVMFVSAAGFVFAPEMMAEVQRVEGVEDFSAYRMVGYKEMLLALCFYIPACYYHDSKLLACTGLGRSSVVLFLLAYVLLLGAPVDCLSWGILDGTTGALTLRGARALVHARGRAFFAPQQPRLKGQSVILMLVCLAGLLEAFIGVALITAPTSAVSRGVLPDAAARNGATQHLGIRAYGVITVIMGGLYQAFCIASFAKSTVMVPWVTLYHLLQASAAPVLFLCTHTGGQNLNLGGVEVALHGAAGVSLGLAYSYSLFFHRDDERQGSNGGESSE